MALNPLKLDPLARAVGVDVDGLPDRLKTTYLLAIAEKMGVDTSKLPDYLATTILEKIVEEGQMGGGSGDGYGKVQEVTTADELDTILANATADDVGRGFLYLGESTETYKYECVYIIREG